MRIKAVFLFLFCAQLSLFTAGAYAPRAAEVEASPVDTGLGPALSVYDVSPARDGSIIGVTALGSLLPYVYADRLIKPRCPCALGEVNGLDRHVIGNHNSFLDTTSDVTAGAAAIAPIVGDAIDVGLGPVFWEDMTVYAETLSVSGALVTLAKYTVQRPLPRVYAGQDPQLAASPGGYRSFYSGHTSLTFSALSAASVTLNLRHHAGVWPWAVTGITGVVVAAERVAAGRHFYTDVAMGALAGGLVGILVPHFHEKNSAFESASATSWSINPSDSGAELAWSRHF